MTDTNPTQDHLSELVRARGEIDRKIAQLSPEGCAMFVDLVGSTSYTHRHGDAAGWLRIQTAGKTVLPIAERHRGRLVKELGDGWLIYFSDPNRALQASIEIQRENFSRRDADEPIELKIGMDFGKHLANPSDIYGDIVNRSKRLADLCEGEGVFLSNRVHDALDPYYQQFCEAVEERAIRGIPGRAVVYQLRWQPIEASADESVPEKLVVRVIWGENEARIELSSSLEGTKSSLISYHTHPLNHAEIERAAESILQSIRVGNLNGSARQARDHLFDSGKALFNLLFPEAVSQQIRDCRAEYLVFMLDDACVHLPWELVHDGQDFLCCRFSVGRVALTKQLMPTNRRVRSTEKLSFLVLSNPTGDLSAAGKEAEELYRTYESDPRLNEGMVYLSGSGVTTEIRNQLKDFDIVHYCGHAEFCPDKPDESGWILSDGKFTAGDLERYAKTYQHAPLLVFSNACHSGNTKSWRDLGANWSFGLANAFLLAGSTHFIGPVQELLDLTSRDFSIVFYKYVIGGHPVGYALRMARSAIRKDGEMADLTWAQYVLYGNPELGIFTPDPAAAGKKRQTGTVRAEVELAPEEKKQEVPEEAPPPAATQVRSEARALEKSATESAVPETAKSLLGRSWFAGAVAILVAVVVVLAAILSFRGSPDPTQWTDKAAAFMAEGSLDEAKAALEKAATIAPEDPFVGSMQRALAGRIQARDDAEWLRAVKEGIEEIRKAKGSQEPVDPWTSRPIGIAFLDFEEHGDSADRPGEDIVLERNILDALLQTGRWLPMERGRLDAILNELKIGSSEFVRSDAATQVGRFFAVRGLLAGEIHRSEGSAEVSLRVIDTETRLIAAMANAATGGDVTGVAPTLVENILERLERDFKIQGRVIEPATQTAQLNIGTNHGVREGQEFDVFPQESNPRAAESVVMFEPIGTVVVTKVDPNHALCRVQSETPLQEGMRAREKGAE